MVAKKVRTLEPARAQGRIVFEVPEEMLPIDHRARLLWNAVGLLDMSQLLSGAKAVEGHAGRDRLSPRMLLTLWLYAISEGIGSAREIERRLESDIAFRWIAGGVRVRRTSLTEFRVDQGKAFDHLVTESLGLLMMRGLLSLDLVAQDGTRVRASASAPSFRREASLAECLEQARLHVAAVLASADDPSATAQMKRAREAAARNYEKRVEDAMRVVQELGEQRKNSHKRQDAAPDDRQPESKKQQPEPRASTSDPDARVMKMADGGFRPAYNVQLATAGSPLGGARTIVGVRVVNVGSDSGSVGPMLDDIERRTGALPKVLLADGNHGDHASIRIAAECGVKALVSVPKKEPGPQADYDEAVVAWRERMKTDEAKELYRARASLCELPNAHLKSRLGLSQFLVRSLGKALSVALLTVLASNLLAHAPALLA